MLIAIQRHLQWQGVQRLFTSAPDSIILMTARMSMVHHPTTQLHLTFTEADLMLKGL